MSVLQIIVQCATLLTLVVLVVQLFYMIKQYKNDHERSRRETVINLQKLWIETLNDKKTGQSRLFINCMSPDVCRDFWAEKEIEVANTPKNKQILSYVCECNESDFKTSDGLIKIEGTNLVTFRSHLIKYLNLLEIIFTAWNDNVGDQKMIEKEFGRNITSNNMDSILQATSYFPSIKSYIKKQAERDKNLEGKEKL